MKTIHNNNQRDIAMIDFTVLVWDRLDHSHAPNIHHVNAANKKQAEDIALSLERSYKYQEFCDDYSDDECPVLV
jgi:hypothetical protein